MKKILMITLLALSLILVACKSSGNERLYQNDTSLTEDSDAKNVSTTNKSENTDSSSNELPTSENFTCKIEENQVISGDVHFNGVALIIEADEGIKDCSLDVNVSLMDSTKNKVDYYEETIDIIGSSQTTCVSFFSYEDYTNIEYTLNPHETSYKPIPDTLEYNTSINKDNVIVDVTNKGDEDVEHVLCIALFKNGDDFVLSSLDYCTDSKDLIKAGHTETLKLICPREFNNVEIYLRGRLSQ